MEHLEKSWLPPIAGKKKFFSTTFYHRLSQLLDKKKFDVVYEGYADPFDLTSEQPDVAIYDKKNPVNPVLLVEFCNDSDQESVLRIMHVISEVYEAKEAYVYNIQSNRWFRFTNATQQNFNSSYSPLLDIDLNTTFNSSISKYYAA